MNRLSKITKYTFLPALLVLGLLVSTSAAQVELGLIGGTTLSNLDASSPDSVGSKLSREADIAVGGIIEFGLSRSLNLVLEPTYSRRSIGSERQYFELPVPSDLSFSYIDLPVLLKFSLDFPLIKPYLMGGGTASLLLEAEETYLNDLGRELYGETVDISDDASEADFSWTVGGGVSVPFGPLSIFAEGRYSQGTIDIFDSDDRDVFHEGFRILGGLTYRFGSGDEMVPGEVPGYYETAQPCNGHRCVGHRLLIIIGNHETDREGNPIDPTIHATANWARSLGNVNHKVLFFKRGDQSNRLTIPLVPGMEEKKVRIPGTRRTRTVTEPGWVRYEYEETRGTRTRTREGRSDDFGEHALQDCCFLEEVIVLTHGSKESSLISKRILDMLPELTGGRRIRKLTLWLCSTSNFLHPGALGSFRSYFGEFCELMAPRPCPCGCKQDLCRTACENPDGRHPPGYSCPGEDDPGTIYMAAWHQQEYRGEMRHLASKLYINPDNATTPLASPNGNVRAITVTSPEEGKWEARTSIEHGARVFDGITVGTQRDFADDHQDRSYLISDLDDRQKPDSGDIPHPPDYEGPRSCAGGEGCIPAGGAM